MIRLHPINFFDLAKPQRFSAWDWIEAEITHDDGDPRPESFRVKQDTIRIVATVKDADEKRRYLTAVPQQFRCVLDLVEVGKTGGTSLGVVVPKQLARCRVRRRNDTERDEWAEKERAVLAQGHLFHKPKQIDFPDLEFLIAWTCPSEKCPGHEMSFHDWGIHELSRKLDRDPQRELKIREKMEEMLDDSKRDVYLMLGNFRGRLYQFGLMGVLSVKRQRQGSLFQ